MTLSHYDKKDLKKMLKKKNRQMQEMFNLLRLQREEKTRVEDEREVRKPRRSEEKNEEVWSAKVATIRNRLTDKKRDSKERWNRFSGTGGEGGRGL